MDDVVKDVCKKLEAADTDSVEDERTRAHIAAREGSPPQSVAFRFAESHVLCVMCGQPKTVEEVFFSQPGYWPRSLISAVCVDCVSQCK